MEKHYDLIVFGATSFVGQILCRYLDRQFNHPGQEALEWAIAGRSQHKLDTVKQGLNTPDIDTILADSHDEKALTTMCQYTRVVVSTVGPYALYGETLIKVCAETGTDYCDLTGEVQWIHRMLYKYEHLATKSGARIVNCCGFDSIPSDMGVYFTQKEAKRLFGQYCDSIKMRVKTLKGGASGGTIASIINITEEVVKDPALLKKIANPYLICPESGELSTRQATNAIAARDPDFNAWISPFIMAAINSRIVLRSNALDDYPYGRDFCYDEAVLTGKGFSGAVKSNAFIVGLSLFMALTALPPTRWLLKKFVLPKPGEGPSAKEQLEGFFDIRFIGKTASGDVISTKVVGQGDPGYGSTGKMLGQAAASLALDFHHSGEKCGAKGGFWTTSSLMGDRLLDRLQTHADIEVSVLN
ncbi:saccharopine dehydrogenase [Veronia nyctiphanis]|uniref:Saccharopine dehydrogenase n=1 Tax=Veronia nyctiphanis TaxID=1278244 RepID=A0A4Q0YMW3_9GAMM|nr:saccharopine dehydrogenase NADP-binding domain-containing protein [Veronia nyctiphanis]RXJ71715.1 saccharopine dehydrogenase [Veronia nyctiphanis]